MSADPMAKLSDANASIVRRILDALNEIAGILDGIDAETERLKAVREASNKFQKGFSNEQQSEQ
jgi:hypothetical protein